MKKMKTNVRTPEHDCFDDYFSLMMFSSYAKVKMPISAREVVLNYEYHARAHSGVPIAHASDP